MLKEKLDIDIASPQGAEAPLDTKSITFAKDDEEPMEVLPHTVRPVEEHRQTRGPSQ